jgi:hypothetical protein
MNRDVWVAVGAALALMSGAARLAPAVPPGATSTATVTASVSPNVGYRAVDPTHVDVTSNTDWRVTVDTTGGIVIVEGRRTGGVPVRVTLPSGTTTYSVTTAH